LTGLLSLRFACTGGGSKRKRQGRSLPQSGWNDGRWPLIKNTSSGWPVSRILSSGCFRFTTGPSPKLGAWASSRTARLCDHLSEQPTRDSNEASRLLSLLGLAPGGGYLAARIAADAGGLLHHLFTITSAHGKGCLFLWPYSGRLPSRRASPSRGFPGAVPYGVRTFLNSAPRCRAAIARPAQG